MLYSVPLCFRLGFSRWAGELPYSRLCLLSWVMGMGAGAGESSFLGVLSAANISGYSSGSLGFLMGPPPLPFLALSKNTVYGTFPSLSQFPKAGTCDRCCSNKTHFTNQNYTNVNESSRKFDKSQQVRSKNRERTEKEQRNSIASPIISRFKLIPTISNHRYILIFFFFFIFSATKQTETAKSRTRRRNRIAHRHGRRTEGWERRRCGGFGFDFVVESRISQKAF